MGCGAEDAQAREEEATEGSRPMNSDMMEALENIEREKGISVEIMLEALANALVTAYKRLPNAAEEALVEIDAETGDIRVIAQELDEEGNVTREWDDTPEDFGRIAAQTAKQVILQRIREAEREMKYEEYAGREGDIVTGIIQQTDARYTLLDLGKVEALLPQAEQVENERRGEKVDIVPYSENSEEFVMKALAPALVREVRIHTETGTAEVIVPDFQLSLAIGKEGQNARLAARLTGWRVDIKSETQLQEEEAGGGVEYAEGEWVKNDSGELVWQPAEGGDAISAAEAGYAAPDPTVVAAKEGDGDRADGDKAAATEADSSSDAPADSSSESTEGSRPAPEAAESETRSEERRVGKEC